MRKIELYNLAIYFTIFCFALTYADNESGLLVHGTMYSDMGLIHRVTGWDNDKFDFTGMNVLSVTMKNVKYQNSRIVGLFDLCLPYGKAIEKFTNGLSDSSGINGLINLYSFEKALLFLNIRKFYLSLYLPFVDITMGRQIINFGKGIVFSPIDVFSVIELNDIKLRRSGSDIVSVHFPLSDLTGVDLISGLPSFDGQYSMAVKFFSSIKNFDFSLVALYRDAGHKNEIKSEVIGGVSFKGDLGIGLYSEFVGHYVINEGETIVEIMGGIDYSIRNKWIFIIEYLVKSKHFPFSIWGKNNIFGSVQYTMNELTSINANVMYNFQYEITQGSVQWRYNLLQNVDIAFYINGIDNVSGSFLQYNLRVDVKF